MRELERKSQQLEKKSELDMKRMGNQDADAVRAISAGKVADPPSSFPSSFEDNAGF